MKATKRIIVKMAAGCVLALGLVINLNARWLNRKNLLKLGLLFQPKIPTCRHFRSTRPLNSTPWRWTKAFL